MGDTFKKLFELSTKLGFLKKIDSQYSFGPLALLLANNIRKEWFQNNVITSDLNVFLYNSHSSDNWQEGKNNYQLKQFIVDNSLL